VEDYEVCSAVGEEGFARLIAAFYRRVPQDDILGPMYPREDLAGAEQRLRDFLIFRFGGPQRYIEERGHPRLRMRHARFPIGNAARDRWMQLMNQAIEEAALPVEAVEVLQPFFAGTATFLINQAES
jgi:hemoglobin